MLIYKIIRIFLFPFVWLLWPFQKKIRKRLEFEGVETIGFSRDLIADCAFEISSEGELEQVHPLIEYYLKKGKKIELLYCSESVQHACLKLFNSFPGQLNLLSLPVLSYFPIARILNPARWISSSKLVLCRYDFFPELVFSNKKIYIVSASLKNLMRKNLWIRYYQLKVYKKASKIVCASSRDYEKFITLGFDKNLLRVFDFRVSRIHERLRFSRETLLNKIPHFELLNKEILDQRPLKKVILGSFWNDQYRLLELLDENKSVIFIAPHLVTPQNVKELQQRCEKRLYIIENNTSLAMMQELIRQYKKENGLWVFQLKGILCELYSEFDCAYVDGGFGESVHSLLEPFIAGCRVFCGPKVFRSSEFDYITGIDGTKKVSYNHLEDIATAINSYEKSDDSLDKRVVDDKDSLEESIKWLKLC